MDRRLPKVIVSALVEKDNKVLLVKEVLESGKECWITPGGTVEYGESLTDAAKREIKEETNLDIDIIDFVDFKEVIRTQFNYHTVIFFFRAKPLNEKLVLGEKILGAKFFGKDEISGLRLVDSAAWITEKYFSESNGIQLHDIPGIVKDLRLGE